MLIAGLDKTWIDEENAYVTLHDVLQDVYILRHDKKVCIWMPHLCMEKGKQKWCLSFCPSSQY